MLREEGQEGENACGPRGGGCGSGGAEEEEGCKAQADGVALFVEPMCRWLEMERLILGGGAERLDLDVLPSFEVLDPCYPPLGVCDHLSKQVAEARAIELRGPASINVPVIDCFAIRGYAKACMLLLP